MIPSISALDKDFSSFLRQRLVLPLLFQLKKIARVAMLDYVFLFFAFDLVDADAEKEERFVCCHFWLIVCPSITPAFLLPF
jgi:hypothetical protein